LITICSSLDDNGDELVEGIIKSLLLFVAREFRLDLNIFNPEIILEKYINKQKLNIIRYPFNVELNPKRNNSFSSIYITSIIIAAIVSFCSIILAYIYISRKRCHHK